MVSIIKKFRGIYEDNFFSQKRQRNWDNCELPHLVSGSEVGDLAEPAPKRRCQLNQMDDDHAQGGAFTAISSFINYFFRPVVPVLHQRSFNEENIGHRLRQEEPRVVGGVEIMSRPLRSTGKTTAGTNDVQFLRSSQSGGSLRKKSYSLTPHPRTGTQLFRDDPYTTPSRMDPSTKPVFDLDADEDDVIDRVPSSRNLSLTKHSIHSVNGENGSSARLNGCGGRVSSSPFVRIGGNDGMVDTDGDSAEEEEVRIMDGVEDGVGQRHESKELSVVGSQYRSPGVSRFTFRPTLTSTADRKACIARERKENRFHSKKIPTVTRGGIYAIKKQSRDLFMRRPYQSSSSLGPFGARRGLLVPRGCSSSYVKKYARLLAVSGVPVNYLSTAKDCYKIKDKQVYTDLLKQSSSSEQCFSRSNSSVVSIASSAPLSKMQMDQEWTRKTTQEIEEKMRMKRLGDSSKDISLWTLDSQIKRNDRARTGRSVSDEEKSESRQAIGSATATVSQKGAKPKDMSPKKVEDDDDDIIITQETVKKVVAPNSLEQQAIFEAFYRFTPDWVQENRARCRKKETDLERQRLESELTLKMCLERRKAGPSVEDAVTRRFKMLDMRHPSSVIDVSEDDVLAELTPDMEKIISNALRKHPPSEVLTEKFNIQITRRDIVTLDGLNWLNDEVVNFYMNMLMERGQNDNYPSVYAFNTFFYPKLIKMGYSGVKRWTKKVDIFNHELLLVPVHLGMHWCLATINVKDKLISYYDSMLGDNKQCLQELKKYLQDEHSDKKKASLDLSEWKCQTLKDIPQQMNGSDCGMFACKFSEYISRRRPITFTQDHMPYFRRRMVYEIITNRLL